MNRTELEAQLVRWLEEGPQSAPEHVVEDALFEARTERQARVFPMPWSRLGGGWTLPQRAIGQAAIGLVLVVVVAVAAWGLANAPVPPAGSPTPQIPPSPTASAPPSAGLSPSSDPEPSVAPPSPTRRPRDTRPPTSPPATSQPTIGPSAGLIIRWVNPPGASGLEGLSSITGSAQLGTRYVIVGGRKPDPSSCAPAIWWADDPTRWHLAQLPVGFLDTAVTCAMTDVAVGGPGFVALSEGLPLWSADGQVWSNGAGDALLPADRLFDVGLSPAGLIAVGENADTGQPIARSAVDGRTWTAADSVAQRLVGKDVDFVNVGNDLIAFLIDGALQPPQTQVWRITDVVQWQQIATIGDSIGEAAYGPRGWVAFGGQGVWLSGRRKRVDAWADSACRSRRGRLCRRVRLRRQRDDGA